MLSLPKRMEVMGRAIPEANVELICACDCAANIRFCPPGGFEHITRNGKLSGERGRERASGAMDVRLSAIARQMNERPRKTLQYQTPAEKFAECVAAIG